MSHVCEAVCELVITYVFSKVDICDFFWKIYQGGYEVYMYVSGGVGWMIDDFYGCLSEKIERWSQKMRLMVSCPGRSIISL